MFKSIKRSCVILALLAITLFNVLPALAAPLVYVFNGNVALGSGGSVSNHTVSLTIGDYVLARATCLEIAPGDRPLDPLITIYNPSNVAVAANDDGNAPSCNNWDTACTTFTAAATGSFRFAIEDAAGSGPFPAPYELLVVVNDPTALCGGVYQPPANIPPTTTTTVGGTDTNALPMFNDGRANSFDMAAPFAAYCQNDGIEVYLIDSESKGKMAFFSSAEEIADVPALPEVNTVIEQGMGLRLFRLTSGEFQIVS